MSIARTQLFNARGFDAELAQAPAAGHLALFRAALQAGRAALRAAYLAGTSGRDVIAAHAWLVDQLLVRAWTARATSLNTATELALVAVGGYGRGELYPASDVDLMLLLRKPGGDDLRPFAEGLLNFLWDMGLEVGHSVRTLKECVTEARNDITVATNIMEARLLAGSDPLLHDMLVQTGPRRLWPSRRFFAAKWDEQRQRHQRYGDTAYNLEPNIKEGPGGLRDIQMIGWVAHRHYGSSDLHELVTHGFLSEAEHRSLVRGRNLLAQVRCGLHYLAGRREDRLLFDYQRTLASQAGYQNKPGGLAVEQFMKDYYRTVKELGLLNEILLQHFQEAILGTGRAKSHAINRRFAAHGGFLEVAHPRVFERQPFAILELFLIMQQHPELKGVRANTIRLLRANLARIDQKFRRDIACRSLFMEILRQPRGITHELRRMNAYGVLGAYLPAFGRVVGQMQHDLFHVYTVDEHTLMVVRNLRRFAVREFREEFPLASSIIQSLVKPERLYLAGLFHDIAKGRGGDHSELGEHDAEEFCRQHGLSEFDTHLVAWLVRHHLIMSWTAQREDISDPDVVLRFAQRIGDQERLDNLYLLTVADMRGTSPSVWNAWKGQLLAQLYFATGQVLSRGLGTPINHTEHIANVQREALELLSERGVATTLVERQWAQMGDDYFLRHDAARVAWHTAEIAATSIIDLPLVAVRYRPEIGGTEVMVYTPDRDDLFVLLTGGFDRHNLSIVDARIHTTEFGFALDTFVVLDQDDRPIGDPAELEQLRADMRNQLLHPQPGRDPRSSTLPRTLKHFPIATRVSFDTGSGAKVTTMEVTAQDRPGLLYQVALALKHCRVRLMTAKVATYGERAEDVFFVTTRDGQPLTDSDTQACLAAGIRERLDPPAAAPEPVKSNQAD